MSTTMATLDARRSDMFNTCTSIHQIYMTFAVQNPSGLYTQRSPQTRGGGLRPLPRVVVVEPDAPVSASEDLVTELGRVVNAVDVSLELDEYSIIRPSTQTWLESGDCS